jgi:hypothetical protein
MCIFVIVMRRFFFLFLCATVFCVPSLADEMESRFSCRRFTTTDGLPQMQTETVWQDSRGYIYIGTLSGFVRYDGRKMTPFLGGRQENIVMFRETEGQVSAFGFVRQWKIEGNTVQKALIDPEGVMLLNNFNASDLPSDLVLLEDRQERNRGLYRLESGRMVRILYAPLLDEMTPDRKLFVDSTGIYVPTPSGLYRMKDGTVRRLTQKADVYSLLRSRDSLLALAGDGIYCVAGDSLSLICEHLFTAPDYGVFARQNQKGQLVVADAHTVWLYDSKAPKPMRQLASGFNLIKGLFIDSWNRLWVATYQGVYCFFHCDFENHRLKDENDIVRALTVCDGHLVTGTLNGSVLVDGCRIGYREDNFFSPGAVTIGTTAYLAGHGDIASVRDGSVQWLDLPQDNYRFVARFADRLILGTRTSLLSFDPDTRRLDTVTTEIAHPWRAVDGGAGRLYVSGNPGLYCITDALEGTPVIKLLKRTPATPVVTTLASDGRETLCFALGDTLFVIQKGSPEREMKEVRPFLSGHEIRAVHLSPRGYLVAAAIDGLLVARMGGTGRAEDIHWFDEKNGFTLIEPQLGSMAEYDDGTVWLAGLEGLTSFKPEALLSDNQQPAVVEIPVPWWRKWWALLAAALLLSFVLWMTARRVGQRQARAKIARLEREKRQKELQLSAVRLKAIPHFHANVLSSIEYFVINKSSDEASHYLKLYSEFTNKTLSDIDRASQTVAEQEDYVRSYLELERLRYGERLQYSITVEPEVDRSAMLPTLLLHTYCQNAVKHGIASKSGTGTVEIVISRQQRDGVDGILVSVKDDGVGRSKAATLTGVDSTRQGLKILQQQIELCNHANKHKVVQQVTDLYDSGGRPAGTCFTIWVPEDYQY